MRKFKFVLLAVFLVLSGLLCMCLPGKSEKKECARKGGDIVPAAQKPAGSVPDKTTSDDPLLNFLNKGEGCSDENGSCSK